MDPYGRKEAPIPVEHQRALVICHCVGLARVIVVFEVARRSARRHQQHCTEQNQARHPGKLVKDVVLIPWYARVVGGFF